MKKYLFLLLAMVAVATTQAQEISGIGWGPNLPSSHCATCYKEYYRTSDNTMHVSNGSAWIQVGNAVYTNSTWSNTATIANSADTLLNSATAYGHFHRVGNIVTFTLRFHVGLGSSGGANTVYISPPIASNFTQEASDVIGTANLDTQAQSTNNTARQRALLFASTSDDKIGVAYDPVASLAFPENRVYISVSGSYLIQ